VVDPESIAKAVDVLQQAANPRRIILFGSYACGRADADSDVDFLVVEERVSDIAGEMVRLRRLLSPLRMAVDVLVVSEQLFNEWRDTPGNVLHEAATTGKVVYEAA